MVRSLLRDSTPRRVFYAKALLEDALTVFPDSVYIRIVYATFLFNWASEEETFRAVSLLVEAARLPASLDLQYALFARITTVLELRRKLQIGTTGAVPRGGTEASPGHQGPIIVVGSCCGSRNRRDCHA